MGHLCIVSLVSNSVGTGGEGELRSLSTESLFGMTGEATTGSRLNRTESLSPSLLNTVYSEAG